MKFDYIVQKQMVWLISSLLAPDIKKGTEQDQKNTNYLTRVMTIFKTTQKLLKPSFHKFNNWQSKNRLT